MSNLDTIKVIGEDLMCFRVRKGSLEPISCGCYDPWAWSDPEPGEKMSANEWSVLRNEMFDKQMKEYYRERSR
jgi:hypothetical protein